MSIRYRCAGALPIRKYRNGQQCVGHRGFTIGEHVGPQHSHRVLHKTHLLAGRYNMYVCNHMYLLPYVVLQS